MDVSARGTPAHTRTLVVSLRQHGPGELEARGQVIDLRKRGLVPMAANLQTAGVIHDMHVRARLALEPEPRFSAVEVHQPHVAFEPSEATGGECCRDPAERVRALVGTPLDEAATGRLGRAFGGPLGCSHVLTLTQLLISTLRSALVLDRAAHGAVARTAGQRLFDRSLSIDGILDGDLLHLVLHQADVHFVPGAVQPDDDPFDRLAGRLEVRALAEVEHGSMQLRGLRAWQRHSTVQDFPGRWSERSEGLAGLAGRSALGGMAAALFETLGGDEADRPLLDCLLNLAPALIQCIPAMVDGWEPSGSSGASARTLSGGMPDSCYMWRSEGFLVRRMLAQRQAREASGG